jgi:tricarboxylate carrier
METEITSTNIAKGACTTLSKEMLPDILHGSRFDLNTYWGRVRHFAQITDMRTLLITDSKLKEATERLDRYEMFRTGRMSPEEEARYQLPSEEELWNAKKIKDSVLHPDLGQKIYLPFRMSAFVPMNVLIVAGMLGARSIPSTIFWQTVNQTYNVCLNYSNRNASNSTSNTQLFVNYLAACGSSVGTAVGLNEWVKRTTLIRSEALKQNMLKVVPFTAVTVANFLNIGLMRNQEMINGIIVKDHEGVERGKSAVAGRAAVAQTIFSRVILIMPTMVVQPMFMSMLEKTALFRRYPVLVQPANILTVGLSIAVSLPICIGLFPQFSSIPASSLEPQFHNLFDSKGKRVENLFYNKGL